METLGIILLVLVVALVVGYVVQARRTPSPDDPDKGLAEEFRGGKGDTLDRPADAGAEGMSAPEPGDVDTGPEDRGRM